MRAAGVQYGRYYGNCLRWLQRVCDAACALTADPVEYLGFFENPGAVFV